MPGANLFFAADPVVRASAEELIRAVGLKSAFVGDATATAIVDVLLPLWFALVGKTAATASSRCVSSVSLSWSYSTGQSPLPRSMLDRHLLCMKEPIQSRRLTNILESPNWLHTST
jgi:hypothetical protein